MRSTLALSTALLAALVGGCQGADMSGSSKSAASGKGSSGGTVVGGGSAGGSTGGSTAGGSTAGGSTVTGTAGTGGTIGGTTAAGTVFAFVSSFAGDAVDVYDIATGQPASSIFSTGGPFDLAQDAQKAIHVPHLKAKELVTYDSATYARTGVVDLSQAPIFPAGLLSFLDPLLRFAYLPAGAVEGAPGKVYVPALLTTTVVQNGAATRGIMDFDASSAGTGLFGMLSANVESLGAYHAAAANGKVYVTNFLTATVTVIDTAIDDVKTTIPVGRGPAGIAIDRNGTAWVCCALDGEVYSIDTRTDLVLNNIMTGVGPIDVCCDNTAGAVYVANYLSGDVARIDALTQQVTDVFAPSNMMTLMAAMGFNAQTMQTMLNSMISGMGTAGNGSTTGGLAGFLGTLLAGNGTTGGGLIGQMMNGFLQSFFQQFNLMGGTGMPLAGIWGIGVSPSGDVLVVSNAFTGQVDFLNPVTKVGTTYLPLLQGSSSTFPLQSSVEVVTR